MKNNRLKGGVRAMSAYVTTGAIVGVTTARKAQSIGCEAIHPNYIHLTRPTVLSAHRRGMKVNCWTPDDPDEIGYIPELLTERHDCDGYDYRLTYDLRPFEGIILAFPGDTLTPDPAPKPTKKTSSKKTKAASSKKSKTATAKKTKSSTAKKAKSPRKKAAKK